MLANTAPIFFQKSSIPKLAEPQVRWLSLCSGARQATGAWMRRCSAQYSQLVTATEIMRLAGTLRSLQWTLQAWRFWQPAASCLELVPRVSSKSRTGWCRGTKTSWHHPRPGSSYNWNFNFSPFPPLPLPGFRFRSLAIKLLLTKIRNPFSSISDTLLQLLTQHLFMMEGWIQISSHGFPVP